MTRPLPGGDTQPWYRQFWPWFLITLPASVVVASLSTAYIANRHADDLVVDDYYKNGLAINRQLEKMQRATELGVSVQLRFKDGKVNVNTSGPVEAPTLGLLLSHPLEADQDFEVTLARVGPGLYSGPLTHPVAANWHWTLKEQREEGWRLDGEVQNTDIGNASGD